MASMYQRKQVRGTQSFVSVMVSVWKRPLLTGTEILWRWLAALPSVLLLWRWYAQHQQTVDASVATASGLSFFTPMASMTALHAIAASLWPLLLPVLRIVVPLQLVLWIVFGALGQALLERQLHAGAKPNVLVLLVVRTVRSTALVAVLALWLAIVRWSAAVQLHGAAARGGEPNVLAFLAMTIVASILLFVGWAALNWPLLLAQVISARDGSGLLASLRTALTERKSRGEVMELNLVLCIVKIALMVLALVFSACPLPFASVETQQFLDVWWTGCLVWYLVFSDLFHTIRYAAYRAVAEAAGTLEG